MTHVSSLYLHVPFCRHLCNYCDFFKKRLDPSVDQFGEFQLFLEESFGRHEEFMATQGVSWAPLETIYLGGGTPSLWGERGAEYFARGSLGTLEKKPDCEFTMEIDPGTWSPQMIAAWQRIGMNRISIGSQTLDPEFLRIMDRDHTLNETHELLAFCHENDWNFSLDFLLGLPFSKERGRDIERELQAFLAHGPKHVSLYILNARSKYPHVAALPEDEFIREEYLLVSEILRSKGFHHYEVSNFSLPGFESRHNLKYWRTQSVAALGPSGTGLFLLGDEEALRYKWKVSRAEFETETLGIEELSLERTYLALRTSEGWAPSQVSDQLRALFDRWTSQGHGVFDGVRVRLSPQGFLMLDSLMGDLFALTVQRKASLS